jgi:hypothetical protein
MVEVWMLFSLFLPFLEVVLQTYVNYLRCQEAADCNAAKMEAVAMQKKSPRQSDFWPRGPKYRLVLYFIPSTGHY